MQSSSSSSSVHAAEMNQDLNRVSTLHNHLRNALAPCYRDEQGELRWCCSNVKTMTQVVHSIDAFLDCISTDISQHRLVKESVVDSFATLGNILLQENEAVKLASNVMEKMVNNTPSSVFETLVLDIVNLVSSSLPSCPVPVITLCSIKLNWILVFLNPERETLVWKSLEENKTVDSIISHLCSAGSKPVIFYLETINLLTRILRRWPSSRFCVWNNSVLMEALRSLSLESHHSLKAAVLHLYSAIALCENGAKELLDSGNSLQLMVDCMDVVNPDHLKLAGFKLAECFVASEEGRIKMLQSYCEPLVKAIINELSNWSFHSENPTTEQMSLIKGACCVSKIICWPGQHHANFWELGIESVLLKLLLPDYHIKPLPTQFPSAKELITMDRDIHELKPHVWDILGGLAENLAQKFNPQMLKSKLHLKILISCACTGFRSSLNSVCENHGNDANGPVCRAVLFMIYSPSKYIVSEVKSKLTRRLKSNAREYIIFLLNTLNETVSHKLQVIKLISLACYSGIPMYRMYVRDENGIMLLLSYIEELTRTQHNIEPLRINTNASSHFCDHNMHMCCYEFEEDWVGDDEFMFFGLLGLAELIRFFRTWKDQPVWLMNQFDESGEARLKTIMQDICINYSASGPRWYAAYILSHFGVYGFPSKIGNRIGSNPELVKVDGLVATVRCLQLQFSLIKNKVASQKLLEYVYSGYLRLENQDLVKSLKRLAEKYELSDLSQILGRSRPIWRTPFPKFDLTSAREHDSRHLWDIVLVAKRNTLVSWECETCSLSQPHLHAHKAILCPSCEVIGTRLHYEMQESGMHSIEADIGWEALVRLVNWFYSTEVVTGPKYGCLWRNLDENEKIEQMIPYVELYWQSECWLLKDLQQECETVIATCLDSVEIATKVRDIVENYLRSGVGALELTSLRQTQQGDT